MDLSSMLELQKVKKYILISLEGSCLYRVPRIQINIAVRCNAFSKISR